MRCPLLLDGKVEVGVDFKQCRLAPGGCRDFPRHCTAVAAQYCLRPAKYDRRPTNYRE